MERKHRKLGAAAAFAVFSALLALPAGAAAVAEPPARLAAAFDARPLQEGSGYGSNAEARGVKTLQRRLRGLGHAPGPIDGLFGPRTEDAVERFQAIRGLTVDGVVGRHTLWALVRAGRTRLTRGDGYLAKDGSRRVRVLQRRLQRRGLRPGPVDGRYGPRTEAAVARLQRAAGLRASGSLDTRTALVLSREPSRRARPVVAIPATALPLAGLADVKVEQGVAIPLALALAAATLLLGALGGGLVARRRGGSPAPAEAPDEPLTAEVLPAGFEQPPEHEAPSSAVRAVGYVSVPKAGGEKGEALESQAAAIQDLCDRRGWELLHVVRDVENGHAKGLERPGLLYALERLAEGEASCIVVSELERLSRSAADLGRILEWVEERDARLVAINLRLDTGSAQGRLTARTLIAVGEWEGRWIGEQTRKGLEAARARRVQSGRPAVDDVPSLKARIVAMRHEGMTLQAIADVLNAEGVPTLRGGSEWRPSSVQSAAGYRRPRTRRAKADNSSKEDGG